MKPEFALPFQDFIAIFGTLFPDNASISKRVFLPGAMLDLYSSLETFKIARKEVQDWYGFEQCELDWDSEMFRETIKMQDFSQEKPCYLVTDEGHAAEIVFQFLPRDFSTFADWYEAHFKMSFFQSADYILFSHDLKTVRIIHHNGLLFCIDPL